MEYKRYKAHIEYDEEDRLFFGRVINLKDIIIFDETSKDKLEQSFHHVINQYLEDYKALNKQPDKPFSLSA